MFKDRIEGARKLAKLLKKYKSSEAVVLGIPRGGAITAKVIAKELSLPMGLLIVRKIGHPLNPEYGIAAISESGTLVKNENETDSVDQLWFLEESQKQITEAKRRREKYLGENIGPNLEKKDVIIVDDGLATGLTMLAAIGEVRKQKPNRIIVAVPVSPKDTAKKITDVADEFVAVTIPTSFEGAVANYYEEFPQIEDEEVIEIMKKKQDPVVFAMPVFKKLAKNIAKKPNFRVGVYEKILFPNQEFQIKINTKVKDLPTIFLGTITPPHDQLFEAFLVCHTLKKEGAKKILAVFPYLAYMRHDRNKPKEDKAVEMLAKFSEDAGITRIITIDIHSKKSLNFFKMPISSISCAEMFGQKIRSLDFGSAVVVAPDEGAIERANVLREELKIKKNLVVFRKKRHLNNKVVSEITNGVVDTERAIIIDDILDTGQTLINCAKVLQKRGVKEILVVVTHGLFSGKKWKEIFNYGVIRIITTDTILRREKKLSNKIVIIPIKQLLIQEISKIYNE